MINLIVGQRVHLHRNNEISPFVFRVVGFERDRRSRLIVILESDDNRTTPPIRTQATAEEIVY